MKFSRKHLIIIGILALVLLMISRRTHTPTTATMPESSPKQSQPVATAKAKPNELTPIFLDETKSQEVSLNTSAKTSEQVLAEDIYNPHDGVTEEKARFLRALRRAVTEPETQIDTMRELRESFYLSGFSPGYRGVILALYQPGQQRILVARRGIETFATILQSMQAMRSHARMSNFDFKDKIKCRLQVDFILDEPRQINYDEINFTLIDPNRFEFGVDGLRVSHEGKTRYFLPGDAFIRSILGDGRLRNAIQASFKDVPFEELRLQRFHSFSFIHYADDWYEMYRGYPLINSMGKEDLEGAARQGIDFVLKNQREDGSFLYFYDAEKDNFVDHEHPKRDPNKNPYYNSLRHSGGGLLLLYHYKLYKDESMIEPVRRAIQWVVDNLVEYETPGGRKAAHLFYNRKSKLGGTGIALYLFAEYRNVTGDTQFDGWAKLMKEHLISEIRETGEFYYYHIYPGIEKDDPRLFSFYYPGEAMNGLVTYYKYVATDEAEKKELIEKMQLAMNFLVVERPKVHANQYASLPSDSWLMMSVNEMWDIPEMQIDLYKDFVFSDADQMIDHQYHRHNALYHDSLGAFFYSYGDHAFPDGARCEGLMGALELARKVGDADAELRFYEALKESAWSTMHLVNTPVSVYAVPNPERAIGGIRFKFTRQWFRVDTIQHVAAFYTKFLPYWKDGDVFEVR